MTKKDISWLVSMAEKVQQLCLLMKEDMLCQGRQLHRDCQRLTITTFVWHLMVQEILFLTTLQKLTRSTLMLRQQNLKKQHQQCQTERHLRRFIMIKHLGQTTSGQNLVLRVITLMVGQQAICIVRFHLFNMQDWF